MGDDTALLDHCTGIVSPGMKTPFTPPIEIDAVLHGAV